jgi:predicted chitinase
MWGHAGSRSHAETDAERNPGGATMGVPCAVQDVRQTLHDELLKLNPDKDWSFITRQIGAGHHGLGQRRRLPHRAAQQVMTWQRSRAL